MLAGLMPLEEHEFGERSLQVLLRADRERDALAASNENGSFGGFSLFSTLKNGEVAPGESDIGREEAAAGDRIGPRPKYLPISEFGGVSNSDADDIVDSDVRDEIPTSLDDGERSLCAAVDRRRPVCRPRACGGDPGMSGSCSSPTKSDSKECRSASVMVPKWPVHRGSGASSADSIPPSSLTCGSNEIDLCRRRGACSA